MENLTLEQFLARFDSEEACADYLFYVKWPNGYLCPRCSCRDFYRINSRRLPLYECNQCHYQASLTVGTVMEGSRTALCKWMVAIFLVSRTSSGVNAVQLSRIINVTYKTAWSMLHKIREAISIADGSVSLSGLIKVNDAFYGRRPQSTQLRSPHEHPILIGASINDEDTPLYIKMKLVPTVHLEHKFILDSGKKHFTELHVEPKPSHIEFTTGPSKPIKYKKLYSFFIQARIWINSTFHGLGRRYLDCYLNEFCFRVNRKLINMGIFESLTRLCLLRLHII